MKKVLFILLIIILFTGCNSKKEECCKCLDCPSCDVCCNCKNPYMRNR